MSEIRNILGIKCWIDSNKRLLRKSICLAIIFTFLVENISFSNPDIFRIHLPVSFAQTISKGIHTSDKDEIGGIDFGHIEFNNLNSETDYRQGLINKSASKEILNPSFLHNAAVEPIYNSFGEVVYSPSIETSICISADTDFPFPQNPPLEYETPHTNLIPKHKKPSWLDRLSGIGKTIKDAAVGGYNYLTEGIFPDFIFSHFGQMVRSVQLAVPVVSPALGAPLLSTL
ncbi:MAG: hypothetical protein KAS87_00495, partial [Candidatus Omnitrophica bacterium]|nr:hypothetical protein [Candidatus Omnitrophota bacterium]